MGLESTISAFAVSPEHYVPGGASFAPGHGGRPAKVVLDEDAGPASVNVAYDSGKESGFSFSDLLDTVNPLHHIPVVGTLYRAFTGDEIGPVARVAGGTLYGGPVGAAVALANVAVEETTGADLGDHVLAMVTGDDGGDQTAGATQLAQTAPPPAAAPAVTAQAVQAPPSAPLAQFPALPPQPVTAQALPAEPLLPQVTSQGGLPGNQQVLSGLGAGRDVPQLSPAAFQTLMDSIGAKPRDDLAATARPAGNGLASGAETAPADRPVVPAAAMEVHRLLQGYAQGGLSGPPGQPARSPTVGQ